MRGGPPHLGVLADVRRRPGIGAIALLVIALVVLARAWFGDGSGSEEGERGGPAPAGHAASARVLRVIDGDTIEVSIDGQDEDVRYIGVDTPETVFDRERRDVYGRLLAYVYTRAPGGGEKPRFVNAALVRHGYARTLTIAPNTAHATQLQRLQARAGRVGRGLWGAC